MSTSELTEPRLSLIGGIVAVFALVLCCAGSALIAGGVLTAIGGVLSNLFVAAGVLIVLAGVGVTMRRHSRGNATCEPQRSGQRPDGGEGMGA